MDGAAALFMFGQTGSGENAHVHTFERAWPKLLTVEAYSEVAEVRSKHAFDLLRDGDSYDDCDDSPLRDAPKPVTLADEVRGTTVDAVCEDIRSPHELLALLQRGDVGGRPRRPATLRWFESPVTPCVGWILRTKG